MGSFSTAVSGMYKMEMLALKDSAVHRLHPAAKMIATAAYVVAVISFGRYEIEGLIPFFFYPAILMALSETPYNMVLKRLAISLPFALFGGIANIIFDRGIMFHIGAVAVSYGVVSFVSIFIKTLLTVSAVLILVATTEISDMAGSLKRAHIPDILILQLVMTYRYISFMLDEARTMHNSYVLRAGHGIKISDIGAFIGQFLMRSMDRADRVHIAMRCKGFDGRYDPASDKMRRCDIVYILMILILSTAFRMFNIYDMFSLIF